MRANKFILKYVKEAKAEQVSFPVSTNPETYERFEENTMLDICMREFAAYLSSHARSNSTNFSAFMMQPLHKAATHAVLTFDVDYDKVAPKEPAEVKMEDNPAIAEVYATATKRQGPPPKGGYPFPKRDDIKSTVRLSPSPCKYCGSSNH
ncbi:hypothetical protein PsYK624_138190 [Phanerochaete sordida]|uniref:Uncharacterized protein n=1 Tax=Phanerochaete sordida TaxID=48140 RepID=A0A9P3GMC9_9APHY|nr:hypothetical protein PsYK624_138190 [Phanerochaete sordida]